MIDEALRLLQERDEQAKLADLRREIGIGVEQADRGELAPFGPHDTLERHPLPPISRHEVILIAEVRRSPQAEMDLEAILRGTPPEECGGRRTLCYCVLRQRPCTCPIPGNRPQPPGVAPNLRSTLVKPYVIFYRIEGDIVQIVRILHGKRDLRSIMQAESSDEE